MIVVAAATGVIAAAVEEEVEMVGPAKGDTVMAAASPFW